MEPHICTGLKIPQTVHTQSNPCCIMVKLFYLSSFQLWCHRARQTAITCNTVSPLQVHIGSSRTTVVQNRDVVKELQKGMVVATDMGEDFPLIGTVQAIPPNPDATSEIAIELMQQERPPHKPKWLRFFKPSSVIRTVAFINKQIILYDFELTKCGTLKKKSREYLQEHFKK